VRSNIFDDFVSLSDQHVEQFIRLSLALKKEHGPFFDSKIISTNPPNIKVKIHLGDKLSLLNECTKSLVQEDTPYVVDKNKTLYVHVDRLTTLQIMIQTLHKFIINTYRTEIEKGQFIQTFTSSKQYQVHLSS